MPALIACTSSPIPGAITTRVECARRAISSSSWPTPTVSTMITPAPQASSTRTTSAVDRESPPSWPRVAIERMNTSPSSACRCIRMRSPRIAPPVKGDDGSTATTPTRIPCLR